MFVVIDRDGSIKMIEPSNVYQGSNNAAVLGIFAPFSVISFPLIQVNVKLPSGEYLTPLVASTTAEQPEGFGAWSVPLPIEVTTMSGVVKISFAFNGSGGQIFTTEEAEIRISKTAKAPLPTAPSTDTFERLLTAIASLTETMRPNWTENTAGNPGYILNKPAINKGSGTATGDRSAALGDITQATGANSLAIGYKTLSEGDASFASGSATKATGLHSIAGGYLAEASGTNSLALGNTTESTAENSMAFGRETKATANNAAAFGYKSEANGYRSIAMGAECKTSGEGAFAGGFKSESNASNAFTYGDNVIVNSPNAMALGRYNAPSDDAVLQVGNGSSDENRKNAFEVKKNGDAVFAGNLTCNKLTPFNASQNGRFVVVSSNGSLSAVEITVGGAY